MLGCFCCSPKLMPEPLQVLQECKDCGKMGPTSHVCAENMMQDGSEVHLIFGFVELLVKLLFPIFCILILSLFKLEFSIYIWKLKFVHQPWWDIKLCFCGSFILRKWVFYSVYVEVFDYRCHSSTI